MRRLDLCEGRHKKQFGYVQEMSVSADMNVVGTNYIIKNVQAKRCAPLHRMTPGAVLLDSWIGVSDMIKEKLVLQTSCGSLIEVVLCADQSPLWDIEDNPRGSYFSTPTFHVGQILVGPIGALENAKWLYTSPEMRGSRKSKSGNRKVSNYLFLLYGRFSTVHFECSVSVALSVSYLDWHVLLINPFIDRYVISF